MRISSLSEDLNLEKRIAVTPEIAKKYISLGFHLCLPKNYGVHLGFHDDAYRSLGASFLDNEEELIKNTEIFMQVRLPDDKKLSLYKKTKL